MSDNAKRLHRQGTKRQRTRPSQHDRDRHEWNERERLRFEKLDLKERFHEAARPRITSIHWDGEPKRR